MPRVFGKFLCFVVLGIVAFAYPARAESAGMGPQTIVLAGGCFWGMEAVYDHVRGVTQVVPGYAGGGADTAHYEMVSTGTTGHAESVQVTYDPRQISLAQILKIYFVAAHNPTELNYQSPDHGSQYRSTVFYADGAQKMTAQDVMNEVGNEHLYQAPIVTTLEPLKQFYPAERYHWNYAALHPDNPYIVVNDAPRVERVKKDFPNYFVTPKG